MSKKTISAFRASLRRWYSKHSRDLPWRRTRDPYRILVSEFMLQQTQVATVLPYYRNWLRRFPDFAALARASETEVLHAWQGLGYYARARNLRATAKLVLDRHRGKFPRTLDEMRKLPGVGKYTAHAIATFAFDESVAIVEANTSRVFARFFDLRIPIDSSAGQDALWNRAASLVPKKNAARYNSAVLDLGAMVCLPREPKCGVCPVKKLCSAKNPAFLPIKRARPATKQLLENHTFITKRSKLLLEKSNNRWREMWILPPLKLECMKHSSSRDPVYISVFPFTNHRITLRVFRWPAGNIDKGQRWFELNRINSIPIPSPHRRAINALLN